MSGIMRVFLVSLCGMSYVLFREVFLWGAFFLQLYMLLDAQDPRAASVVFLGVLLITLSLALTVFSLYAIIGLLLRGGDLSTSQWKK